jgi:hydrogenase expression/formation protein HypC
MQVIEIAPDGRGVCDADGSRLPVSLIFIDDPRVGDYVIVHAGYAIERWDTQVAEAQLADLRTLALALEGQDA